jgi:hypothetical protein
MKIQSKDKLSTSNSSYGSIGVAGGITREENSQIDVSFEKKNVKKSKSRRTIPEPPVDKTYFKQHPVRKEESGAIRHYITDIGPDQHFEIFVWFTGREITRYDLHYDIRKDERMLSWKIGQKDFTHAYTRPEKLQDYGFKSAQTLDGSMEFDRKSLKRKFLDRYQVTKEIRALGDRELIRILDVILRTFRKLK